MSRCVIISAAPVINYKKISKFFRPDDFVIFCDGGLAHSIPLGVKPDLIVGDFDSFDKTKLHDIYSYASSGKTENEIETLYLPCEKDDTDTFFAVKEGLKRGYKDFLLLGVIGNRFDHSLCNISALIYIHNHGANGIIADDFSEMEIVSPGKTYFIPDKYSYFSLMNIAGNVSGVTIKNAKYPLENAEIKADYSFGISNEVLPGKNASVYVKRGILLLLKIW